MRLDRLFLLGVPLTILGTSCSNAAPVLRGSNSTLHVDSLGRTVEDVCPESLRGPNQARCYVKRILRDDITPFSLPAGLQGSQIPSAYNIPSSSASGGAIIAVIDAGGDATVLSDLQTYRTQFGLPAITKCTGLPTTGGAPCLSVVNQTGGTRLPASQGWEPETALDTQMVSAGCPDCSILLVEANSQNNSDLDAAVDYAASVSGVVAITNSYGWPETGSYTPFNVADNTHYNHPGVLVVAASGDADYDDQGEGGTGPSFPASSGHVLAVGGTMLSKASTTRGWSETVWNLGGGEGTGSGCSSHFAQPAHQAGLAAACPSNRITNDVAAAADFTGGGILEYCTASACGYPGWSQVVGTSAAAPMVTAFLVRLGQAGNVAANRGWLYTNSSALYDVTSGKNTGTCTTKLCKAGVGWDGPTGVGTPNGTALWAL
jgi:subtilase family serine protease